jgi:hypothetical protein
MGCGRGSREREGSYGTPARTAFHINGPSGRIRNTDRVGELLRPRGDFALEPFNHAGRIALQKPLGRAGVVYETRTHVSLSAAVCGEQDGNVENGSQTKIVFGPHIHSIHMGTLCCCRRCKIAAPGWLQTRFALHDVHVIDAEFCRAMRSFPGRDVIRSEALRKLKERRGSPCVDRARGRAHRGTSSLKAWRRDRTSRCGTGPGPD